MAGMWTVPTTTESMSVFHSKIDDQHNTVQGMLVGIALMELSPCSKIYQEIALHKRTYNLPVMPLE